MAADRLEELLKKHRFGNFNNTKSQEIRDMIRHFIEASTIPRYKNSSILRREEEQLFELVNRRILTLRPKGVYNISVHEAIYHYWEFSSSDDNLGSCDNKTNLAEIFDNVTVSLAGSNPDHINSKIARSAIYYKNVGGLKRYLTARVQMEQSVAHVSFDPYPGAEAEAREIGIKSPVDHRDIVMDIAAGQRR